MAALGDEAGNQKTIVPSSNGAVSHGIVTCFRSRVLVTLPLGGAEAHRRGGLYFLSQMTIAFCLKEPSSSLGTSWGFVAEVVKTFEKPRESKLLTSSAT